MAQRSCPSFKPLSRVTWCRSRVTCPVTSWHHSAWAVFSDSLCNICFSTFSVQNSSLNNYWMPDLYYFTIHASTFYTHIQIFETETAWLTHQFVDVCRKLVVIPAADFTAVYAVSTTVYCITISPVLYFYLAAHIARFIHWLLLLL